MGPDGGGLSREPLGTRDYVFTKEELAERLKVSVRTIEREVAAGRLRPLHWGRRMVRFASSEVERYLQDEAPPQEEPKEQVVAPSERPPLVPEGPEFFIKREPWFGKKTLAQYYGCSVRWIDERVREGMPCCMIAGKRKFRLSQIEPWLRERGYISD